MTFLLVLLLTHASPAPARDTLSLQNAVDLSRARSPIAAAARARLEGAERAAEVAGRLADPELQVTAENLRPWASDYVASTDMELLAVVTQPLDLFTRGGRKAEASGERDEAGATRVRSEHEIALDTVRSYVETARGRELVAALEAQVRNLGSIVTAMEHRVAEGYAPEADLLRFRAEAARARNELAAARIGCARAEAELAFLVGRPVANLSLSIPPPPPLPDENAASLVEKALVYRPDVIAARARAARTKGSLSLELGRRYPDLSVAGGYKRTTGLNTAVVGILASVPVFARNGRAVARARADARAADLELEATVDRARADSLVLLQSARDLSARLADLDQGLVVPAEEALRSALAAFREGATEVLRVVDAERTNTEARREALDLTVQTFLAICRARLAAGMEAMP
jgi:cobalt-zinc-cadmium efflux system outer membrane protein